MVKEFTISDTSAALDKLKIIHDAVWGSLDTCSPYEVIGYLQHQISMIIDYCETNETDEVEE